MICIDFRDFPNNPPSFGFNSLCQNTLFFSVFDFPEATGLKKGKVREHVLEISYEMKWATRRSTCLK
jgi:hypothetical protein